MRESIFVIITLLLLISCSREVKVQHKGSGPKIKAVTIHCKNAPSPETWKQFQDAGITHIVSIPKATIYDWPASIRIADVGRSCYWSESMWGIYDAVKLGKKYGISVIVKLHLYPTEKVTSMGGLEKIPYSDKLGNEYRTIVLRYAKVCEDLHIPIFVMCNEATEFYRAHKYWCDLISSVRRVYSGKITVGACASSIDQVTFWDKLDYIGVSAYYPVAMEKNPSEIEMKAGWLCRRYTLLNISTREQKPVLFTEFGCNASEWCAVRPWEWQKNLHGEKNNFALQAEYYSSMFDTFWTDPWFAGICVWQCYSLSEFGKKGETLGTPQGHEAWQELKKRGA